MQDPRNHFRGNVPSRKHDHRRRGDRGTPIRQRGRQCRSRRRLDQILVLVQHPSYRTFDLRFGHVRNGDMRQAHTITEHLKGKVAKSTLNRAGRCLDGRQPLDGMTRIDGPLQARRQLMLAADDPTIGMMGERLKREACCQASASGRNEKCARIGDVFENLVGV